MVVILAATSNYAEDLIETINVTSTYKDNWGGRDRKYDITADKWIYYESPNSDLHMCTIGAGGKVVGTNRQVITVENITRKVAEVEGVIPPPRT